MLELSAIFVYEYFICEFIYGKQKKQGRLDLLFSSKAKQLKLQLNEEPDKVNGNRNTSRSRETDAKKVSAIVENKICMV